MSPPSTVVEAMERSWPNGLHRRSFIHTNADEGHDTIRLVSPIVLFQATGSSDDDDEYPQKPYRCRTKMLIALAVVLITALCLGTMYGYLASNTEKVPREPPDPVEHLPPSPSKLRIFQKAAVCTDAPVCSKIGRSMLTRNGSAVDAAIAAMFCNGLLNQQSMGIGGGFFMTVYIKGEGKAYVVNARETAPGNASTHMYQGEAHKASRGPLAVGVPGEVRGMWAAHRRWGKLPWAELVQPTLELCEEGYQISAVLYDGLLSAPYIRNDPQLRKQYYNSAKNEFHKPGTMIKPSEALCNTLQRIALKGGDELYNGTLAVEFVEDLNKVGSIISAEDLRNYEAKITEPLSVPIGNGDTLFTPPPPSGGANLINILNILAGYHFNASSINGTEAIVLTYHRILEAFKHAYATRSRIGDADFLNMTEILKNVSSSEYAQRIRLKINDSTTYNDTERYDVTEYNQPDDGTAHISIIGPNGDAVSVTSSINYYYGAGFTTLNTGILMNNVMDDFSSPGFLNYFGIKPSPANFIQPGKRPMSSMSPSVVVDSLGNAKLVIGASGGTKITTAVALVTMRTLWLGQTVKQAVDEPRLHHQVFPMLVEYEYGLTEDIVAGLRGKGHGMLRYRSRGSIVCALYRNSTAIYANSDYRKGGDVAGMN